MWKRISISSVVILKSCLEIPATGTASVITAAWAVTIITGTKKIKKWAVAVTLSTPGSPGIIATETGNAKRFE